MIPHPFTTIRLSAAATLVFLGRQASCIARNVGTQPVSVQVQLVRNGTTVIDFAVVVSPGSTAGFFQPGGAGEDGCTFTFSGPKNSIRGVLLINDAAGNTAEHAEAR